MKDFLNLVKLEWNHGFKSARRDGWSRKYSMKHFLSQLFCGVLELPALKEERNRSERRSIRCDCRER